MFSSSHEVDEVAAFLRTRFADVSSVTLIGSGEWSQAFRFRTGEGTRVVRFGQYAEDYAKDRIAGGFAGPDLPVPEIHEIGAAFDGSYAVSTFAEGVGFDTLDEAGYRSVLPAVLRSFDAIREIDVSHTQGFGIWSPKQRAPFASWRELLLDVCNDRPHYRVHGWREILETRPKALANFAEGYRQLERLVDACPEQRHMIHADLMGDNLLVQGDRVCAALDWANAMYGDFLYDVARMSFWTPWFPGIHRIDLLSLVHEHYDSIGLVVADFETRLRCYQVHLGLEAQAYNAITSRWEELELSGQRTLELAGSF